MFVDVETHALIEEQNTVHDGNYQAVAPKVMAPRVVELEL